MTTMTFQSHVNTGIPGFSSSSTAQSRVAGAEAPSSIVRAVALDRGNLLRIRNGRGARIRVASGVLWVTEENSPEDHVLLPGDVLALAKTGTAIVFAHRPARVVVEVPPGVALPRAVEMALADGERGRRIALAAPTPTTLSTIARSIAAVIGPGFASIGAWARTLKAHWDAVGANMESYPSIRYSDGLPPRRLRRSTMCGTREIERVVIDDSMLWRM